MSGIVERAIDVAYRYEGWAYVGMAIALSLAMLWVLGPWVLIVLAAILLVSVLIYFYLRYMRKRYEDERQHQIYGRAAWRALLTMAFSAFGLMLLTSTHIVSEISSTYALIFTYMTLLIPFFGWCAYYFLTGAQIEDP